MQEPAPGQASGDAELLALVQQKHLSPATEELAWELVRDKLALYAHERQAKALQAQLGALQTALGAVGAERDALQAQLADAAARLQETGQDQPPGPPALPQEAADPPQNGHSPEPLELEARSRGRR